MQHLKIIKYKYSIENEQKYIFVVLYYIKNQYIMFKK